MIKKKGVLNNETAFFNIVMYLFPAVTFVLTLRLLLNKDLRYKGVTQRC